MAGKLYELDERKQRVLKAVIDDYIESAEPVGSRALARKHDLGVSPATIRNEMADLEMLGYLQHLHTSSGRVPSSKGYRFYVDGLIPPKPVSDEEKALIDRWYKTRVQRIDQVFVGKLLKIPQYPFINFIFIKCRFKIDMDNNSFFVILLPYMC